MSKKAYERETLKSLKFAIKRGMLTVDDLTRINLIIMDRLDKKIGRIDDDESN